MEILLNKTIHGLEPANDFAAEALRKVKVNSLVKCDIKQPRNQGHHRKYWALVQVVFENQDHYATAEHLHVAIKVATGHCDSYPMKCGNTAFIPRSISFASMDQTAFNEFYERACDVICKEILPGTNKADLQARVMEIIAPYAAQAVA